MKIKIIRTLVLILLIPFLRIIHAKDYKELKEVIDNKEIKIFDKNQKIIFINQDNLEQLLVANNKELKKYLSQIKQAEMLVKAEASEWSPRFNISSASVPSYATGYSNNKFSSDTSTQQFKLGLDTNIEWDLIKPGRKLNIKIAKDKLRNSKNQYQQIFKNIYLETLKKFYSIQALMEEIKVAKKAIEISQVALKDSENKFTQGIGNKLSVLEAKTQLHRDQITLLNKKETLKSNKNILAEILDLKDDFKIEDYDSHSVGLYWEADQEESFSSSIKNSEEIMIGLRNIDINNDEAFVILSDKKPNFTLYNKYSFSSANGEAGSTSLNETNKINDNNNTIGLRFKWNIFDGGKIKQNYLAKKNRSKELELDLKLRKNEIFREIKDLNNKYKNIKEKIIYSYQQLKAAEESLFISMKRMDAGITTQREVVNTQGDVIEAETNFINSLKEYKIILAEFFKLTNIKPQEICQNKKSDNYQNKEFLSFLKNNDLLKDCKII